MRAVFSVDFRINKQTFSHITHMKRNLLIVAIPAAIAASYLAGCSTPSITARTNPGRPSIVQVSEGYDTLGRRWEDQVLQPRYERIYQGEVPTQSAQPKVLSRNESEIRSYSGTITDIDHAGREMTLRSAQGQSETFSVSKEVRRFDEAKVGDKVNLTYHIGFNAEVRKPTAEEQQNPLVVLEATGRAGAGEAPAGSSARQIRAVVTIEALNRVDQTITVKGPRGNVYTARVANPSRLDDVHIGDTIVMTFTEALAVSLNPAQ